MKYEPFSKKQLQLLTWWTEKSPLKNRFGVIAEGSIRAGKTICMSLSFLFWSMQKFKNVNFAICGKTVGSVRRNVIMPLIEMLKLRGYKVVDKRTEGYLIVSFKGRQNRYYIFGGKDESSAALVQGITLAGAMLDEVALMPRSFVEQVIGRCSVTGSKLWFNCNPDGPRHWFKQEWVDKAEERNVFVIHFMLYDNPSLSKETIQGYYNRFSGIFFKRFILGEWAFSDGVIYSNIRDDTYYTNAEREKILPAFVREGDIPAIYGVDYGTVNPCVFLEAYKYTDPDTHKSVYYIDREYTWDSKKSFKQKTDEEYANDLLEFVGDKKYGGIYIDPSAESLSLACMRRNLKAFDADNDVLSGISMVASMFTQGRIKINKDNCIGLVMGLGLYIWDDKKALRGIEAPLKMNDHWCDALRYIIYSTCSDYEVFM